MRSVNIQADILSVLSDGKFHTTNEIAEEVEICSKTVKRHIQALSYRHNIQTFHGGDKKGGVRLILNKGMLIDEFNNNELQLIMKALESLQCSNAVMQSLITRIKLHLKEKEVS